MNYGNSGDPSGRRLARRRALLLAEAGQFARALGILLRDANFESDTLATVVKEIASQERIESVRADGRLEGRKRFRHLPYPFPQNQPVVDFYLDESGKSPHEPPPSPPFFALAGIAMTAAATAAYKREADRVKREFFGTVDVTFHEPDMRERKGPFYFSGNIGRYLLNKTG